MIQRLEIEVGLGVVIAGLVFALARCSTHSKRMRSVGKCPVCAYPMDGRLTERCSECGLAPMAAAARAARRCRRRVIGLLALIGTAAMALIAVSMFSTLVRWMPSTIIAHWSPLAAPPSSGFEKDLRTELVRRFIAREVGANASRVFARRVVSEKVARHTLLHVHRENGRWTVNMATLADVWSEVPLRIELQSVGGEILLSAWVPGTADSFGKPAELPSVDITDSAAAGLVVVLADGDILGKWTVDLEKEVAR